jgi:hypothetical protein
VQDRQFLEFLIQHYCVRSYPRCFARYPTRTGLLDWVMSSIIGNILAQSDGAQSARFVLPSVVQLGVSTAWRKCSLR